MQINKYYQIEIIIWNHITVWKKTLKKWLHIKCKYKCTMNAIL